MDASAEGLAGKPFEMTIETGKLREFARAIKASYTRDEDAIAPVTFLMSAAFWQDAANAPWRDQKPSFERLLHGEQEFVFHGVPPRAGTRLRGVVRVERVYEKEGSRGGTMTFIETVTEYRSADDDAPVADVRATLIETSKPAAG
jgi:hypothetical protein